MSYQNFKVSVYESFLTVIFLYKVDRKNKNNTKKVSS